MIYYAGSQTSHWDIKDKEIVSLSEYSCFVQEVPVHNLPSSLADLIPCDRIVQRTYESECMKHAASGWYLKMGIYRYSSFH